MTSLALSIVTKEVISILQHFFSQSKSILGENSFRLGNLIWSPCFLTGNSCDRRESDKTYNIKCFRDHLPQQGSGPFGIVRRYSGLYLWFVFNRWIYHLRKVGIMLKAHLFITKPFIARISGKTYISHQSIRHLRSYRRWRRLLNRSDLMFTSVTIRSVYM